jgi:RHS repeat-associated protein
MCILFQCQLLNETARLFDFETGLYYYRARYYNPYIGRFLQTDPVGYSAGMNLYRYCVNNPLSYVDPSGLLGIADLPWNLGDTIQVQIAFYDGGDEGAPDRNGDGIPDIADGAMLLNAANDFKITVNGVEYDAFLDFRDATSSVDFWIREMIGRLNFRGYEVTDVYFFDHSTGNISLEFGEHAMNEEELKKFGWAVKHDRLIPDNCTFHFRNCRVANDKKFLKNLAKWFGHSVTGCVGDVGYSLEEKDGPDYSFNELWIAQPPGWTNLWLGSTDLVWEKYITDFWGSKIPNPDQQPY